MGRGPGTAEEPIIPSTVGGVELPLGLACVSVPTRKSGDSANTSYPVFVRMGGDEERRKAVEGVERGTCLAAEQGGGSGRDPVERGESPRRPDARGGCLRRALGAPLPPG